MLDFPSSPATGQTYTGSDGTQWKWDGVKWVSAQQAIAFPITIPQGGTGATTAPAALTALGIIATAPTTQRFTSGSGTYTTPGGVKWIEIEMVGGGSGGNAGPPGGGATAGTATLFGTSLLTANGGSGTTGGTATGGDVNVTGANGGAFAQAAGGSLNAAGSPGASSPFGGAGPGNYNAAGGNAQPNTGSGGGGGGTNTATQALGGTGGGAGGYLRKLIGAPLASYAYTVGTGGAGGTASGAGQAGGAGGSGSIFVIEHYNY